jgi:methionine-gamma-lyase
VSSDYIADLYESFPTSLDHGINAAISDSATFCFDNAEQMSEFVAGQGDGRFIYGRHLTPTKATLARALSIVEQTEAALVTASGMCAVSAAVLQLCNSGDEIISSRTIYGGTYALLANLLPRFGIKVTFLDFENLDSVRKAITPRTRLLYCESISNPLLEVHDLCGLAEIARAGGLRLMVDNTFSPLILTPSRHGAHIVIVSLTKFVNGMSDGLGGAVCCDKDLVTEMLDVNSGTCQLLGGVLDDHRAASVFKNLHTLHIRMQKHSVNAQFVAQRLEAHGVRVRYPGLRSHPHHGRLEKMMNHGFGFGGLMVVDALDESRAHQLVALMRERRVGHAAVSLGCYRTLFSVPASSTSVEIPAEKRREMGLSPGLVRISLGLESDPERVAERMLLCCEKVGLSSKKVWVRI